MNSKNWRSRSSVPSFESTHGVVNFWLKFAYSVHWSRKEGKIGAILPQEIAPVGLQQTMHPPLLLDALPQLFSGLNHV